MRLFFQRLLSVSCLVFGRKKAKVKYKKSRKIVNIGVPRLRKNDVGLDFCVACFLCSELCPTDAIKIEPAITPEEYRNADPKHRRYAFKFEIDAMKCTFCGYCVAVCPVGALEASNNIPEPALFRSALKYNKNKLFLQ